MPIQHELLARIQMLEQSTPDYWTFGGKDRREGAHGLFHYPAMMVPEMQGSIIDLLMTEMPPGKKKILDPFVGSGTILVESMLRGLDFTGVDINPLAILLCQVKAFPVSATSMRSAFEKTLTCVLADKGRAYFTTFPGQAKWFTATASIWLSRIARAIEAESDLKTRKILWVAFCRVVRQVCNSRSSTYKLHQRTLDEVTSRTFDFIRLFTLAGNWVIDRLEQHALSLSKKGHINGVQYSHTLNLLNGNILEKTILSDASQFDLIVTSPPYGDNKTTIPYGQYSFLPLQWIPAADITPTFKKEHLLSAHATDTASLGGSNALAIQRAVENCARFPTFQRTADLLKHSPDGLKRFCSFSSDLANSVTKLARHTNSGGFHAWTIGERTIAGVSIPLGTMLIEMLEASNVTWIYTANRRILSKQMAQRNTLTSTMGTERVIIGRKR